MSRDSIDESLKDRICLVTGANSGLGRATTQELARLGATVVMVCRNREKGEEARLKIEKATGSRSLDLFISDFSSLDSIRSLAQNYQKNYNRLHVLINNAGLANLRRTTTSDGLETTFQVNYLAPFLLTNLLLGTLKSSAPSRIVNVSSVSHYGSHLNFEDLNLEKDYGVMRAYGQSKLALVLFTRKLAEMLEGSGVTAYSLHPGAVATNIWTKSIGVLAFIMVLPKLFMRSPREGADTIVFLATAKGIEGKSGEYFEDEQVKRSSRESHDDQLADKLWQVSADLCGISLTPGV